MDYSKLNKSIIKKLLAAIALINNPEIDPRVRQLNQEILFREVGQAVYTKVYDMNAFDFEIEHTRGKGIDNRYYGLAKVVASSPSTGDAGLNDYARSFLDSVASQAQRDAFVNAKQSGKFPTLDRRLVGTKNCKWCMGKAGFYTDPGPDAFARHSSCDCALITAGYKSRNGLLKNYVKPKNG